MAYVEIRDNYDSELNEANGIVSTAAPIMAVCINDSGETAFVEDVVITTDIKTALMYLMLPETVKIIDSRKG